jgi:hypothetical protein
LDEEKMLKPWECEGLSKDGKVSASGKHDPFENFREKCVICNLLYKKDSTFLLQYKELSSGENPRSE